MLDVILTGLGYAYPAFHAICLVLLVAIVIAPEWSKDTFRACFKWSYTKWTGKQID